MITIYGHQRCVWCKKAKDLAEQYNLEYSWKDTDDQTILNELKTQKPEVRTVPQIWWDNRYLGGYENFADEVQNTLGGFGEQKF